MALGALRLESISHSYDGAEFVLRNVDLSVDKGERIALIGPSGQGKSTLLKIMAGLVRPHSGKVYVEGSEFLLLPSSEQQKLRCRMGMLFQKNALFDSLKVGDNIAFPLREATSQSEDEIQKKVKTGLESVGISHAEHLFPDEMSGGMQKRLGIARAQALDPDFLFYDDPTAGLDPITSRKIIELIKELQQKSGSTIVVVTNEMARAYQVATRIWFVARNRVLDLGTAEMAQACPDPDVQQFIHGRAEGPLMGAL